MRNDLHAPSFICNFKKGSQHIPYSTGLESTTLPKREKNTCFAESVADGAWVEKQKRKGGEKK